MNTAPANPRSNPSRKDIVERAEQLLRDRPTEPLPIAHLSLLVGVSERGLRNAFNTVRGMSPKRFVIHDRLQGGAPRAQGSSCEPRNRNGYRDGTRLLRAGAVRRPLQGRLRRNAVEERCAASARPNERCGEHEAVQLVSTARGSAPRCPGAGERDHHHHAVRRGGGTGACAGERGAPQTGHRHGAGADLDVRSRQALHLLEQTLVALHGAVLQRGAGTPLDGGHPRG